ncbi:MAG: hypothetical protein D6726_12945 [Nitrospirae bacterium]|nr:MAG: hypothetical protein D6726_12945 [Nitrospirota bacterium]
MEEVKETTEVRSDGGDGNAPAPTEEKKGASWKERYMRFKANAASNPDSLFLFPFGRTKGASFIFTIVEMGKQINRLKMNAVFLIPMDVVKKEIAKTEKLAEEIWKVTKKYVPSLYDFDRKQWRSLNDSIEEKRILAKRTNTFCIIPRSEEIGQIGMALKVLHKASIELQQDDLARYEAMINDYLKLAESAKALTDELKKTIKEYRKKKDGETA